MTAVFTCPCCGATSSHPEDLAHGYCSRCHAFTGDPELRPPHLAQPCPERKAAETAPLNPKCTDFCTGGQEDVKGHRPTGSEDILFMRGLLERLGRDEPLTTTAAVSLLYRRGYGYHAVADALGISHEEGFLYLTRPDYAGTEERDG
jgi:hypothetical protein